MSHVVIHPNTYRRLLSLAQLLKLSMADTITYLLDRVASEEPA